MATKTLTITTNAYQLLAENKLEQESFSQEVTRILTSRKKKSLLDFFGILSEEEGEGVLKAIELKNTLNVNLLKKRLKEF